MSNNILEIGVTEKTFQIFQQPARSFPTYFDKETGITVKTAYVPEFDKFSNRLFLRGQNKNYDYVCERVDTYLEDILEALKHFCKHIGWDLKISNGKYLGELE